MRHDTARELCPTGCECQAVRPPGVNDTTEARMRDDAYPRTISSENTTPVKLAGGYTVV